MNLLRLGNVVFVKKLSGLCSFALLASLVLTGCAGVASKPGAEQEKLIVAGLSQDLIYEYLLGDIAARRGDPTTAAGAMTGRPNCLPMLRSPCRPSRCRWKQESMRRHLS